MRFGISGQTAVLALAAALAAPASAQLTAAGCGQYKQLVQVDRARVKALHGAQTKDDVKETTFTSTLQPEGFKDCTIVVDKDKSGQYEVEHLACRADLGTSEPATKHVEGVYACLKDGFSARKPTEALLDGKYRLIAFSGDYTNGGPTVPVKFGTTDYATLSLDKNYAASEDISLNVWYRFVRPKP
jgi:hypothetical protein